MVVGGLPPALRSAGFHYVWQSLRLCVLEGSGLITHGGEGAQASLWLDTPEKPALGGRLCPAQVAAVAAPRPLPSRPLCCPSCSLGTV